ncbi:MAG TPA: MFS transporter [Gracilimonas sp.]|uniref:CynX/NimT family MFS transporter n=1 Tax=Gracilimonas sp. TaxID=1974203 RepID=UPI002D989C1A|nr:MFS transporter [Gracilimonas sp.]
MALSMRSPLSSVGPLTEFIQNALGLSYSMIGLITTLPLICFAALSGFTLYFTQRFGLEVTLGAALFILTVGTVSRYFANIPSLYLGTLLIGIGIAVMNVLMPSIVKRDFPQRSGFMTSLYSGAMGIGATLGAGLSVPLAHATNWQFSLGSWAILSFIGLFLWIPQLRNRTKPKNPIHIGTAIKKLGSSPIAWQIALFMGLQSLIFYAILAWLPEILIDRGMTPTKAGLVLSISQGTGILGSLIIPVIAGRFKDQRRIVMVTGAMEIIGVTGILITDTFLVSTWAGILGFGLGGNFSLALLFMVLRADSAELTTGLSGMAQSVGYFIAAFGPVLFGFVHDITNSWDIPLFSMLTIAALQLGVGLGAARNRTISG